MQSPTRFLIVNRMQAPFWPSVNGLGSRKILNDSHLPYSKSPVIFFFRIRSLGNQSTGDMFHNDKRMMETVGFTTAQQGFMYPYCILMKDAVISSTTVDVMIHHHG